ncbi:MAG: hypothetical protein H7251_11980 [Acetobacteraceae bacterium]|nr:hypothetical protein [Acetobacteraceae bacterium]
MKARATGAAIKNPARYRDRPEPKGAPLGNASAFLDAAGRAAWIDFKAELPWLMESDRAMMEIVCVIRGRIASGEVGATLLSTYQACLTKLGATPVDRSRIAVAPDEAEDDEFFGRC